MPILFGIHSDRETWESREAANNYVAFEVAGLDQGYKVVRAQAQFVIDAAHPAGVLQVYLLDPATPLEIFDAGGNLIGSINSGTQEGG